MYYSKKPQSYKENNIKKYNNIQNYFPLKTHRQPPFTNNHTFIKI